MLGRTDRRLRLVILLLALVVGAGALVVRQAYWAIVRAPELVDLATQQTQASETIAVQRGGIYDRTGKVLLAGTAYRDELVAYPDQLTPAQVDARSRHADRRPWPGRRGRRKPASEALQRHPLRRAEPRPDTRPERRRAGRPRRQRG